MWGTSQPPWVKPSLVSSVRRPGTLAHAVEREELVQRQSLSFGALVSR